MGLSSCAAEAGYFYPGFQAILAMASLAIAGLLLRYRRLVDPIERPSLLPLAGLIASIGLGCLVGILSICAERWLLLAGQVGVVILIGLGVWRLQRQLSRLRAPTIREQPEQPEQDLLTGLPGWPGLVRAFEHIRTYYVGSELEHTLLILQVSGVEAMNHAYGTYAGDTALMLVAQTLRDKTRTLDVVAYLEDQQFGVLLAGCPLGGGLAVAESLRDAIADLSLPNLNRPAALSVAIGAAPFNQHISLDHCWEQAEAALVQAKQAGRGQIASPPTLRLLPLSVAYEAPQV